MRGRATLLFSLVLNVFWLFMVYDDVIEGWHHQERKEIDSLIHAARVSRVSRRFSIDCVQDVSGRLTVMAGSIVSPLNNPNFGYVVLASVANMAVHQVYMSLQVGKARKKWALPKLHLRSPWIIACIICLINLSSKICSDLIVKGHFHLCPFLYRRVYLT